MVLAQELGLKVEKRQIPIEEIFYLREAGCCGTATVISPVKSIKYKNRSITILRRMKLDQYVNLYMKD